MGIGRSSQLRESTFATSALQRGALRKTLNARVPLGAWREGGRKWGEGAALLYLEPAQRDRCLPLHEQLCSKSVRTPSGVT